MAREDRPPSEHLSFLAGAAELAKRWHPFALLRGAEARAPGLPRIGRSRLPSEDVVEIVQDPALGFVPHSIATIESTPHGLMRVSGHWFGLVGSMGPLPLHLGEYAAHETRYGKSRPFGRFLDLVGRRMQQFFYRAWADSQAGAHADRPDDDRFAGYISAVSGAGQGAVKGDAFPAAARLAYAALFASRRSAIGIEDSLSHLLGQSIRLLEYQKRLREVEPEDRTQLGKHFATLGDDALLGRRVPTVTDAFRVVVKAGSLADYRSLLPGGPRNALAASALDAFAPSHLEWDMAIEIATAHAPATRLDAKARLGWTSWLQPQHGPERRCDAHLRRSSGTAFRGSKAA